MSKTIYYRCLFLLAILLSNPAYSEEIVQEDPFQMGSCQAAVGKIIDKLFTPVQGVYADIEAGTDWIYWNRIGPVFRGIPEAAIHEVFDNVSKADFLKVVHAHQSIGLRVNGERLTPMHDRFLQDLYDFGIVDTDGVFWKTTDHEQRMVYIREAMDEIDRRKGIEVRLEDIGDRTEEGVSKGEEAVVTRGVHDTTSRKAGEPPRPRNEPMYKTGFITWDPLVRFIWSVYPRVEKIVNFTKQIRARMQHAFLIDRVVIAEALDRHESLRFVQQELMGLKYLLANTATQIADARDDLKKVFERELTVRDPLESPKVNYYRLSKAIDGSYNAEAEHLGEELAGESDLDRMDVIINAARARHQLPPRRPDDYSENGRRFRHRQYERVASETESQYNYALSREASVQFTVHYKWTVTHKHYKNERKSDGKGGYTTERVHTHTTRETKRSSITRNPSYENILLNSYNTSPGSTHAGFGGINVSSSCGPASVTSIDGLDEIKHATQDVRASETSPFWNVLESHQTSIYGYIETHASLVEKLKEDSKELAATYSSLQASRTHLIKVLEDLDAYRSWSDSEILSQWSNDNPSDFRARNDALAARFRNMIKFYDVYSEQLKRLEVQLKIAYTSPSYTEEFALMHKRMIRNLWIKWTTVTVLTVSSIAGYFTYDHYRQAAELERREDPTSYSVRDYDREVENWRRGDRERFDVRGREAPR